MTRARISVILFFRVMLLFLHIGFCLAIAAEVCAILERISDFGPSSGSVAPRYLNFPIDEYPFLYAIVDSHELRFLCINFHPIV